MTSLWTPGPVKVALLVLLTAFATTPKIVTAKSPVKLKKFTGAVDVLAEGPTPFVLSGTGSHLGQYEAYGEIQFGPGDKPGSLVGDGVAVFEAASGDLLVGVVTWTVDAGEGEFRTSHIHFAWRDFVVFDDGTIVVNTGRFVDDRPPGLVVIAIIAILIGLLVPAIATPPRMNPLGETPGCRAFPRLASTWDLPPAHSGRSLAVGMIQHGGLRIRLPGRTPSYSKRGLLHESTLDRRRRFAGNPVRVGLQTAEPSGSCATGFLTASPGAGAERGPGCRCRSGTSHGQRPVCPL